MVAVPSSNLTGEKRSARIRIAPRNSWNRFTMPSYSLAARLEAAAA